MVAPKKTSCSSWSAEALERRGLRRAPHEHAVVDELALLVERRVGLGDDVFLFLVGGEIHDLVGDLAVLDDAVRRLDEAEAVDSTEAGEAPMRPMLGPSGVSIGHMRP